MFSVFASTPLINAGLVNGAPLVFSIGLPEPGSQTNAIEKDVVALEVAARVLKIRPGESIAIGIALEEMIAGASKKTIPDWIKEVEGLRSRMALLGESDLKPLNGACVMTRVRFGSGQAVSEQLFEYLNLNRKKKSSTVRAEQFTIDALLERGLSVANDLTARTRLHDAIMEAPEKVLPVHIAGLIQLAFDNDQMREALGFLARNRPDLILEEHSFRPKI
ncbi:MAG: hypothetical protein Q7T03_04480 [Deltaproteobacteria bacterium]|nr:hypothetical protein [Deltaproteobacteria bacterium]